MYISYKGLSAEIEKSMVHEENIASNLDKRLMGWGNERKNKFCGEGRVFDESRCDHACVELVYVFCGCAFWECGECGNGWGPWLVWRGKTSTHKHQWLKLWGCFLLTSCSCNCKEEEVHYFLFIPSFLFFFFSFYFF